VGVGGAGPASSPRRRASLATVMTAAALAALDALAGLYLVTYRVLRERCDAAGVTVVGGRLMACGLSLSIITPLHLQAPEPVLVVVPLA